jgi:hypothetical protein
MKKSIFILSISFILFGISSCEKTKDAVDELTEFDINYSTNLTVPTSSYSPNAPVDISTPEIPTNSASSFSSNKTTRDLVSEIKMTKFNISTTSANLDFLKSLTIYIKTGNLGDVAVATKTLIPSGVQSITADLSGTNIKEHIFSDKIQFRVTVNFNSAPVGTQNLKMDQTVRVKATLIK